MKIRGILFDIDGTLANTLSICIKAYQHSFEHFLGRTFSDQEITAHFGITEAGIFRRFMPEQWEEGVKFYFDTYAKLHEECRAPFPGITEALKLLQEHGILTGVVTGKGDYCASYTLKYLGLAQYFDRVEFGDDRALAKAAAIGKVLAAWQIKPAEAAYVGDTPADMEEARKAGVLPLGADWAETSTLSRLDAQTTMIFPTMQSFINWIGEHTEANNATSS